MGFLCLFGIHDKLRGNFGQHCLGLETRNWPRYVVSLRLGLHVIQHEQMI